MNNTFQTLITLLGGGLGGAIVTLIVTYLNNKHQIDKIKLTYRQKLDDAYRENARRYIEPLYKPLDKQLLKVREEYQNILFRAYSGKSLVQPMKNNRLDKLSEADRQELRQCIEKFYAEVSDLLSQGDSSYLTPEIGEKLEEFKEFLKLSISYNGKPQYVYHPYPGFERTMAARSLPLLLRPFMSRKSYLELRNDLRYAGLAPLDTVEFMQRFRMEVKQLRSLIGDVIRTETIVNAK